MKNLLQQLAHSINSEIRVAFSKIRESYPKTLQGFNFSADTGTMSSTPLIHTTNALLPRRDKFLRYPLWLNYFNYQKSFPFVVLENLCPYNSHSSSQFCLLESYRNMSISFIHSIYVNILDTIRQVPLGRLFSGYIFPFPSTLFYFLLCQSIW